MNLADEKWLLDEYDEEMNGGISPKIVDHNTKKKLWWKCSKGHRWQAKYISRSKRHSDCPYCAGRKAIIGENDLATLCPDLLKEWDYEKNAFSPESVKIASGKRAWWKCEKGHSWCAVINTRSIRGYGCPYCSGKVISGENDLKTLYPKLMVQWDYEKNVSISPEKESKNSHKKVWWKCEKGHEFQMTIQKRTANKRGCPYCSGRCIVGGQNDLKTTNPHLLTKWNYSKNDKCPSEYKASSTEKVWWICNNGHEWQKQIIQQVKYNDCPYCTGRKFLEGVNDVASLHPEIVKIWNLEKNGTKASQIKYSSHKKVWWKCDKGHEWQACMYNVVQGKRCPYCSGRRVVKGINDLETVNPILAKEWHYEKNRNLKPSDVSVKSNKKVWWQCDENQHEWRAKIADRSSGCGCPKCQRERWK